MFKTLKKKLLGKYYDKKQEIKQKTLESINPNYPTMTLAEENCKSFGVIGPCTAGDSIDDTITSNLAYDKYQGLMAYGTKDGHIKLFSLKGYEQEVFNAHDNIPVMFVTFAPS